jgi:hypothetical protein
MPRRWGEASARAMSSTAATLFTNVSDEALGRLIEAYKEDVKTATQPLRILETSVRLDQARAERDRRREGNRSGSA